MEKPSLISYVSKYPKFLEWNQIEKGRCIVPIDKIIGSSKQISKNYYIDFTPKPNENNLRYKRVTKLVKEKLILNGNKPLDLGNIHLFRISNDGKYEYFVGMDGNRRISNCKCLNVKFVYANVTEVEKN